MQRYLFWFFPPSSYATTQSPGIEPFHTHYDVDDYVESESDEDEIGLDLVEEKWVPQPSAAVNSPASFSRPLPRLIEEIAEQVPRKPNPRGYRSFDITLLLPTPESPSKEAKGAVIHENSVSSKPHFYISAYDSYFPRSLIQIFRPRANTRSKITLTAPFSFLALPSELRRKIYSYLVTTNKPIDYDTKLPNFASLSLVSRRIRDEVGHVFYSENLFSIATLLFKIFGNRPEPKMCGHPMRSPLIANLPRSGFPLLRVVYMTLTTSSLLASHITYQLNGVPLEMFTGVKTLELFVRGTEAALQPGLIYSIVEPSSPLTRANPVALCGSLVMQVLRRIPSIECIIVRFEVILPLSKHREVSMLWMVRNLNNIAASKGKSVFFFKVTQKKRGTITSEEAIYDPKAYFCSEWRLNEKASDNPFGEPE